MAGGAGGQGRSGRAGAAGAAGAGTGAGAAAAHAAPAPRGLRSGGRPRAGLNAGEWVDGSDVRSPVTAGTSGGPGAPAPPSHEPHVAAARGEAGPRLRAPPHVCPGAAGPGPAPRGRAGPYSALPAIQCPAGPFSALPAIQCPAGPFSALPAIQCHAGPALPGRTVPCLPYSALPAIQCPAGPYSALPGRTVPCLPYSALPAIQCPAVPYSALPCHTVPCLPYSAMPGRTVPCLPYSAMPGRTVPCLPYSALPCRTSPGCSTSGGIRGQEVLHESTERFYMGGGDGLFKAYLRPKVSAVTRKNPKGSQSLRKMLAINFRLQEYVDSFMPVDCLTPACSFRYSQSRLGFLAPEVKAQPCRGWTRRDALGSGQPVLSAPGRAPAGARLPVTEPGLSPVLSKRDGSAASPAAPQLLLLPPPARAGGSGGGQRLHPHGELPTRLEPAGTSGLAPSGSNPVQGTNTNETPSADAEITMTFESHASPAATAGAVVAAPGQLLPPEAPGWDHPAASSASATHQAFLPGASRLREQQPPPSQPRADFTSSSPASLPKAAVTAGTQFLQRCSPTGGRPPPVPPGGCRCMEQGKPPDRRKALAHPSRWLSVYGAGVWSRGSPRTGGRRLPIPPGSLAVGSRGKPPDRRKAFARSPERGAQPRQETQRTARSILIPQGSSRERGRARLCRVKNESLFLACPG
ncbi:spidroin-2-like [Ammospiza caudacuta]|uniref:spidroin-2-like n=1 Tax=Ammospiza caudacuta TaxID=2857398 RepID=UPI0027396EE2|nr:spidroin-2-like [Ammospiza caudacuta]